VTPNLVSKDQAFTYLVTPRFKVSTDTMVYARFASGYRPGGPNPQCLALSSVGLNVCEFGADKTENYEVGVKGDLLDKLVSFDASVYYIDWRDIQLGLRDTQTGLGYNANAGRAKSQGIELSVESRPLDNLTVAGWVAWNDAELTEAFPANSSAFAEPGDKLPYSSPFSANLALDYDFALPNNMVGFAGSSVSYVDERAGGFKAGSLAPQPVYPSYVQVDLRTGVRLESWTVNAFVNNLSDRRGVLSGDPSLSPAVRYIQPRMVGFSVAKKF
jgi:outer membrane receptor protein involved in Fe transport